jgi:PAT family beta-lactamase induction signal transducer AmpG
VPVSPLIPSVARDKLNLLTFAAILYFSEGFPYGIVTELAPIYLRVLHVPLAEIGLLSTVGFAWTAKFFWSPLVEIGTYRRWIAGSVAAMALLLAWLAASPQKIDATFWIIVTLLAIASATQDIAVDAFTIRATPNSLLGPVNSVRVMAYRGALMVGGGGLAALAGRAGWRTAFIAAAIVPAVVFAYTFTLPDDRSAVRASRNLLHDLAHWLRRPRAGALIALVLLYRLGEFAIVPMIKPYWVDLGYSPAEIGTITTVVGVIVSVLGAVAGGAFLARFGLYRGLLWLGLAQVISNIGYALVATFGAGRWGIYAAAVGENLGYGLGTASFLAFLMAICDKERAATEYALLSATFGLSGRLIGSISGLLAQTFGYAPYFWLTVFLGVPALLLLPKIRPELETA